MFCQYPNLQFSLETKKNNKGNNDIHSLNTLEGELASVTNSQLLETRHSLRGLTNETVNTMLECLEIFKTFTIVWSVSQKKGPFSANDCRSL